jgi:hypothetical protein
VWEPLIAALIYERRLNAPDLFTGGQTNAVGAMGIGEMIEARRSWCKVCKVAAAKSGDLPETI